MHIKPFQAVFPNLEFVTSSDSFFNSIREEFNDYFDSGFFNKAPQEAFYVYQIRMAGRTYTGLVACVDIRDYLEGHLRQHEHTLASKEQKQMQLMLRRKAAVKPVLLTYPRVEVISAWLLDYSRTHTPFFEVSFEKGPEHHLFWEVRDGKAIQDIQMLFEHHVPNTYIADGHHRTTTTAMMWARAQEGQAAGSFELLLSAFFPSSDIDILDFNRVVEGLNEHSQTSFMAHIAQYFDIDILPGAQKPDCKHELTMMINREWYRLRWKEHVLLEYAEEEAILDAMLLDEKILQNFLGIEDVRSDQRVKYVEGPKGLEGIRKAAMKREECVAFCLYPIQLEEMIRLANVGKVLPPKSTWFEPRMKNGLIVKEY